MGREGKQKPTGREVMAGVSRHGLISVMGRKRVMEDAVAVAPCVVELGGGRGSYDFFGVYDGQGRGGPVAARWCRARMHVIVAEAAAAEEEEEEGEGAEYWERVMRGCFAKMDEEVVNVHKNVAGGSGGDDGGEEVGSTAALIVMVGQREIAVANCGDSGAVLCRAGGAVPLSRDIHKPGTGGGRQRECEESSGGRLNGTLADSGLSTGPEVTVTERAEVDEFLVIASKGLWDAISDEDTCGIVRSYLDGGYHSDRNCADQAAAALARLAVAGGSKDNISVIIVELRR